LLVEVEVTEKCCNIVKKKKPRMILMIFDSWNKENKNQKTDKV